MQLDVYICILSLSIPLHPSIYPHPQRESEGQKLKERERERNVCCSVNMRERSVETIFSLLPSTSAAVVPHTDSLDGPQAATSCKARRRGAARRLAAGV
jgi:hypothetical protein